MRLVLLFFIFLPLLYGCTIGVNQPSNNSKIEEDIIDDGAIGYTALETIKNNQKFEIMFGLPPENLANGENSLVVSIFYDGFPKRQINETGQLKFDVISAKGEKLEILLSSVKASSENLKEINDLKKKWKTKILEPREFIISKQDYAILSDAKFISYYVRINQDSIKGDFPNQSILNLKKYSKKLLHGGTFKAKSLNEIVTEFEPLFVDFAILKAGTSKKDIENHFKTTFINNVKDSSTGCYEEIIESKIGGIDIGALIIGFNEENKLVYVRDLVNKEKITWLKP